MPILPRTPFSRIRLRFFLLPAVVAVWELIQLLLALRLRDGQLANLMVDDAFYYIVCAKNFAALGRWTFDGVEPSSGFHLLWAYIIAAIYRVHPTIGLHALYMVMELIQTACMAAAAWLAVRTAVRLFGPGAEFGVALVFLSAFSLLHGQLMMESPLVIFVSALTIDRLCRTEGDPGARELAACALIGLAGMLARSDYGLLPAVLLAMQIALRIRRQTTPGRLRAAALTLAGSVAGAIVVTLHTHWISGEWMQSSARQKLFWSQLRGFSSTPVRHLLLNFFNLAYHVSWSRRIGVAGAVFSRAAGAALILGASFLLWHHRRDRRAVLLAGMGGVVLAYLFLYRYNTGELQDWYLAHFETPIALVAGAAATWFLAHARRATLATVSVFYLCGLGISLHTALNPAPEDCWLYTAGLYLRAHPELRPAASWNTGQISYFSGGGVINLDGLVNDRIYPYAKSDTLVDYIRLRHIHTIIDFSLMLDPAVQTYYHEFTILRRQGVSDGRLQACVQPENPWGGPTSGNLASRSPDDALIVIYHVEPRCWQ